MPKFAEYDGSVAQPAPVVGWYDDEAHEYPPALAPLTWLKLTDAQWAQRMSRRWSVQGQALMPYTPSAAERGRTLIVQARTALKASDVTMLRCFEHGVAPGVDWVNYRAALRAIIGGSSSSTAMPARPAYPTGT